MIDHFCLGLDLLECNGDLSEEVRGVILKNAEAFLRSGGNLSLDDWYGLSPESRSAFVTAGNRLLRESAVLYGLASQSEHTAAQIMSANDGGDMMIRKSILAVLAVAQERIQK